MKQTKAFIKAWEPISRFLGLFLGMYRQLTQTNLRVTGTGKVENQGIYYNVIFHMVYQAPKNNYTIKQIEAEAVVRFNLSKCLILDINELNKDTKIVIFSDREEGQRGVCLPHVADQLKYMQLQC